MNTNSKKFVRFILISLLLFTSVLTVISSVTTAQAKAKMDAQEFHDAMRKLWEDHITWTRLVIIGTFADLPALDLEESTKRLLQNQVDIGNAIKPFYGEEAGNQLTALLRQHILIAAAILQAAEDDQPLDELIASWYANADDIAEFLNAANPENWPLEEMKAMMREHLDLTLEEATTYLSGDYAASIAAYDMVHLQALEMADMLSTGIIKQFPKKFKGGGAD